jgi:hypothetical protein
MYKKLLFYQYKKILFFVLPPLVIRVAVISGVRRVCPRQFARSCCPEKGEKKMEGVKFQIPKVIFSNLKNVKCTFFESQNLKKGTIHF